ncbi:MAG: menaquinone biosynthetic enzyme MqnA/MqnD family protein [Acidobacteriota bacterium]
MAMGRSSRERLRVARIGFLNVLPIFHPLETGVIPHGFEFVSGTPSYLNGLMAAGDLDLGVVSSIEYARHPERYFILPDLSISCFGPVKSVILFSRVPIADLAGETILATAQSHTSVALLKVFFALKFGMEARFETANCSEALSRGERPAAFLAIGDEALRLSRHETYTHRMDLGEAWREWTGLPFVFAVWVIQRKAFEQWNGRIKAALTALADAKAWGRFHLDEVCSVAALKGVLTAPELREYYQCLGSDLGPLEQQGLKLFYDYLQRIGEIDAAPRLDICSPLECVA